MSRRPQAQKSYEKHPLVELEHDRGSIGTAHAASKNWLQNEQIGL